MSHYRPKKHNEYKIGIVSKKEYKDLVPHKEYADKTFGFANPKERTAIIVDTGNKKLNQQHMEHELEELIISVSPHEVDGIRYGFFKKIGNWFQDKVIDPVKDVAQKFDEAVLEPIYEPIKKVIDPLLPESVKHIDEAIKRDGAAFWKWPIEVASAVMTDLMSEDLQNFMHKPGRQAERTFVSENKTTQMITEAIIGVLGVIFAPMTGGASLLAAKAIAAAYGGLAGSKGVPEGTKLKDAILPVGLGAAQGYGISAGAQGITQSITNFLSSPNASSIMETAPHAATDATIATVEGGGSVVESAIPLDWGALQSGSNLTTSGAGSAASTGSNLLYGGAAPTTGYVSGGIGAGAGAGTGAGAGINYASLLSQLGTQGQTASQLGGNMASIYNPDGSINWANLTGQNGGAQNTQLINDLQMQTSFSPNITNWQNPGNNMTINGQQIPTQLINDLIMQMSAQPNYSIGGPPISDLMGNLTINGQQMPINSFFNDPNIYSQLGGGGNYLGNVGGNMTVGGQPYMDYNTLMQNIGQGMPQGSVDLANYLAQIQGQNMPPNNLTYSNNSQPNLLDNLRRLLNNQATGQTGGGQTGGQAGLWGSLGQIYQGVGGAGTLLPLAMLAYLNQKDYDYPSPSAVQWPTWMEQVRQGTMNPAEYGLASNKFQSLMGTDPTEQIMAGLNAQQDIDRQKYEKYINPLMASQGQYDSTYRANMLGDYLAQQQSTALGQRGQLAQWVPEFQAGLAGQLGNLGSQISSSGSDWYNKGLGYTGLENTPIQRGFELEYAKVAKRQAADEQLASLMGMGMMSNLFPQNPVYNPNYGTGQNTGSSFMPYYNTQGQDIGNMPQQSDLQKYLGYGQTGLQTAQVGQGLWNLGQNIWNWF